MTEIKLGQERLHQNEIRVDAKYQSLAKDKQSLIDSVQSKANAYIDKLWAQTQHTSQTQAAEIHSLRIDLQGQKDENASSLILLTNQSETIRHLQTCQSDAAEWRKQSEQNILEARREIEDLTLRYANDANALEICALTGVSAYYLLR